MKISFIILTLVLFTSYQTIGQEKKENHAEFISKIDSIVSGSDFNGVILVSKDSNDIYYKSFGYSDLENKIQMDSNDQFVIGSISKQITAVLILREYEKGNLKLDDKINIYLQEIQQPWSDKITVHHLLTHTHGISDLNKPLEFEQGSEFKYSQLGYELLARILEKITGKTFEKLTTEFFHKYGLKNTFHPQNKKYKHLVKGYEENKNGTLIFATNSLENYAAAGSFISNAWDLKKWNQLLHSEQLVKKETLKLMSTKYATRIHPVFETVNYGYGLLFKDGEQNIQIGALGYVPGFVSACYFYPRSKISIIVLENTATDLDAFKKTFKIHMEIMEVVKKNDAHHRI